MSREVKRLRKLLDELRRERENRMRGARRYYGKSPRCVYCGDGARTTDHIVPRSAVGGNHQGNLVPACFACNTAKGSRSLADFLAEKPSRARRFARSAIHAHREHLALARQIAQQAVA